MLWGKSNQKQPQNEDTEKGGEQRKRKKRPPNLPEK
jgi:hypothetical protein